MTKFCHNGPCLEKMLFFFFGGGGGGGGGVKIEL